MSTLREYRLASEMVIAHIRNASFGPVELRNTHPFRRELAGRVHIFAHNGDLPGIEDRYGLDRSGFAVPVGNTDSEYAFCLLMQKLTRLWSDARAVPSLSARKKIIAEFAQQIGVLGPANFLYSDGDALFVHGHMRTQADGTMRAPGLHTISISCDYGLGRSDLASVKLESEQVQKVTLVSTTPLNDGDWKPMQEGELLILRGGEIVDSHQRLEASANWPPSLAAGTVGAVSSSMSASQ